ncbi:MAG TPA: virulence factor, partial [Pyrinomonadaceae bacterium]|nr:virulence factor [Pyrinomonadaceae bacterium]
ISSVFRVEDFMAIQRKPTARWEDILSQARAVLEYASLNNAKPEPAGTSDNKWCEVTVAVQYFRDLRMLVKVSSGTEATRLPLPERFGKAIERAMGASENMLMERKWKDEGLRFGDLRDVGEAWERFTLRLVCSCDRNGPPSR